MSLTGLSVAWRMAHQQFGLFELPSQVFATLAVISFVTLAAAYLGKVIRAPDAAIAEFRHPVASSLFGTVTISLLLLPLVVAPISLLAARVLWIIGAVAMASLAAVIVDRWLGGRFQPAQAAPAWMVPVIGLLDIPLALPTLQWPELHAVRMGALAVGLFFAIPLFTLILSRLVFGEPLPGNLRPSLLILLAPFSVGTSAYVVTSGRFDAFAEALTAIMVFLLPVLAVRLRDLRGCCPFRVSWWAAGFPLAASAIATFRCESAFPGMGTTVLAAATLALATGAVVWLVVRTLYGVATGELRALSGP